MSTLVVAEPPPIARSGGPAWAALFPAPVPGRAGRPAIAGGAAAVLIGAAVSLLRTTGPGPFDTVWAEDATYLSDALAKPVYATVALPLNGYLVVLPRLLAQLVTPVGAAWMPAAMTIEAALVTAALAVAVYVASRAHLDGVLPRLIAAVPVVASPIFGAVPNNLATLQFPLLYASFWMLLWAPARRAGRAVAITILVATGASSILALVLVPLALLRLYARRTWADLITVAAFLVPVAVQLVLHVLGLTPRTFGRPDLDLYWASRGYLTFALPRELFGQEWVQNPPGHLGLSVLASLAVVAVLLATPLLRRSRAHWPLVVAGVAYSAGFYIFCTMALGSEQLRYAECSGLMLTGGLAGLVLAPGRTGWLRHAPAAALLALVLVVGAVNLRTDDRRDHAQSWAVLVHRATVACHVDPGRRTVQVPTAPPGHGWHATLPCPGRRR